MSLKAFPELVAAAKAQIEETTVESVRERMSSDNPPVLIDVREDAEWEKSRIPGAIHLGRGIVDRDIGGHVQDPDAAIVLYCASGGRSAMAAQSLQTLGYTNVESMAGGITAWSKSGYDIE